MDLISSPFLEPSLVVPQEGPLSAHARKLGFGVDILDFGSVSNIRRPFRLRDAVGVSADFWRAARALNRIAMRRNAALVHSNGLKAHAIALAARRIGGKPVVIHIRDIANTSVEKLVWRGFQIASDRTVLVSHACWPAARLPGNTHVIYNAFDCPAEIQVTTQASPLVVGFVGRIHPHKGLHVLIDAIALVRKNGIDANLIVRGSFAPETPQYEGELRRQVTALDLDDAVDFAGFVSDPDRVYDGMHMVCVPSTMPEPFGRSAMEAMGRGLAVVASPSGGLTELIEDERTGLLAGTARQMADSIVRLSRDDNFRRELGLRARASCMENFSRPRLHRQIRRVHELALGNETEYKPDMG